MKVFVEMTRFAATATRSQLRERVRALEDSGITGVSVSDHFFGTRAGSTRAEFAEPSCDPITTLAVIAGMSDQLAVQTMVMNTAWIHPGILLRQFRQLAAVLGGDRVTAGLGAGWSAEEFDALGLALPKFAPRMDRFAEVMEFARGWFDGEVMSIDGEYVVSRQLPPSPPVAVPPRLLVGGGSDRILALAGRFADLIDLHGDPRHGKVAGATMATAAHGDAVRRSKTTIENLADRLPLVDAAATAAGRTTQVQVSTQLWGVLPGTPAEVADQERRFAGHWDLDPGLTLGRSPYFLVGSPAQMAEALAERIATYRLSQISLPESGGFAGDKGPDPLWFCREVLSQL